MIPGERPRVVIVGGGFAGLAAAKGLAGKPVDVWLIDRKNHHVFQPLLYQVATALLSPADVSAPLRSILRKAANVRVVLGEVVDLDLGRQEVVLGSGDRVAFEYLLVATGSRHSYFGHDEWEPFAPGLKTMEDALELRRAESTARAGERSIRAVREALRPDEGCREPRQRAGRSDG